MPLPGAYVLEPLLIKKSADVVQEGVDAIRDTPGNGERTFLRRVVVATRRQRWSQMQW